MIWIISGPCLDILEDLLELCLLNVNFCHSLCNTTTTSKQTLLLHADGKKHRAKAKAFHASQKQADGAAQTADVKETGAVPTKESAQVNGGKSGDHETDEKDAGKRKRTDDMSIEEPDNTKRQHLPNSNIGEVIQSKDGKSGNKTKGTADEHAGGADCISVQKQKIKWKKIITKTLKSVSHLYKKCQYFPISSHPRKLSGVDSLAVFFRTRMEL